MRRQHGGVGFKPGSQRLHAPAEHALREGRGLQEGSIAALRARCLGAVPDRVEVANEPAQAEQIIHHRAARRHTIVEFVDAPQHGLIQFGGDDRCEALGT